MIRAALLGLALWLAAVGGAARAHEFMPALLTIEGAGGEYRVLFKLPALGNEPMPLTARFPGGCRKADERIEADPNGAFARSYALSCAAPLAGAEIAVEGLDRTPTDVIVRVIAPSGAVQTARVLAAEPRFTVAAEPTTLDVAATYTVLGMQHILLGLDHVLFVFALLLLIRRRGTLLWTITAFTAAHSITLALAALGFAQIPGPAVEALVALSIVFLAAEVVQRRAGAAHLSPPFVAFAFGLLHGLGFGGALARIGLPQGEIALALVTFNVGVELGQLAIVTVALLATLSLRRLLAVPLEGLRPAFAYSIGMVAAVWFAERMLGILAA